MGRPPIGDSAMTAAERKRRQRASEKALLRAPAWEIRSGRRVRPRNTGTRQQNNELLAHFKAGLTSLNSLPRPQDIVPIARPYLKRYPDVEGKLRSVATWLKDFMDAYESALPP